MNLDKDPVKILYIMGVSRSGSTLLDIVLGSHSDVLGVGELVNAARNGWLKNEDCSCGRPVGDCPFWSEGRRVWGKQTDEDLRHYAHLQDSFERYRRLPSLLRERRNPSPGFREYADATRALFEAIREVSGKPVIVDSSKNPVRALALSMVPGVDLSLVHLTRDGRGVAASLGRSWRKDEEPGVTRDVKGRPVWRTAVFWIAVNLLSGWVRRRAGAGRSIRVRYEDLVSSPAGTLREIGALASVDFSRVVDRLSRGSAVEAEHNIAGNRLRMSKDVRLRPDTGKWRSTLSEGQKQLSWALMGWLLRSYGYKR